MKALILSGGQSLRLRPLTDDRPKALIELNGKPVAEYQIEWLVKNSLVDGVVFACGYKWERLKEHFGKNFLGIPIEYSVEEEPLGTGGAVKRAISRFENENLFVVANGDIITDLPLKRMIDAHGQAGEITASMLVVPYRSRFGVVKIDKLKVVRGFDEKPAFPDVWINGACMSSAPRRHPSISPKRGTSKETLFPG